MSKSRKGRKFSAPKPNTDADRDEKYGTKKPARKTWQVVLNQSVED